MKYQILNMVSGWCGVGAFILALVINHSLGGLKDSNEISKRKEIAGLKGIAILIAILCGLAVLSSGIIWEEAKIYLTMGN